MTSKEHPLYKFLKSKKKEEKGWIFEILPISLCDKKSKQIQGNSKVLYLVMTSLFVGHESKGGELSGWKAYLMRAWAVSSKFLGRSFDVFID